MVRLGIIGPASAEDQLREALAFLLGDAEVDQVIYLGDGDQAEAALARWAEELERGEPGFLARALELALEGDADEIEVFLAEQDHLARLAAVRRLPPSPARAIEMLDDRMVLFVHDKAILDEDDIANATLIAYGRSKEAKVNRFGKRVFITPGPLAGERVGLIESSSDGLVVSLFDLSGAPVHREVLAAQGTKLTVAS